MVRFVLLSSMIATAVPSSCAFLRERGARGWAASRNSAANENVLPLPFSLSTVTSPPMSCASIRAIARPNPVPPWRRVVELSSCEYTAKTRVTSPGVRPMPVSETSKRTAMRGPFDSSRRVRTTTSPASVNFTALPDQVDEHLAQASGVAEHEFGHVRPDVHRQLDDFGRGGLGEQR